MHPGVKLLIVLTGEEVTPILGDKFEAVGLQVCSGHGVDVLEKYKDQ